MIDLGYERKNRRWIHLARKVDLIAQLQNADEALETCAEILECVGGLVREWKPVTICRDCRFRNRQNLPGGFHRDTCGNAYGLRRELRPDDFCPYGQKKLEDSSHGKAEQTDSDP